MINEKGTVSFKSESKYIGISGGKITVKRGTPKGTYRIKVTALGNTNYYSTTKTIRIIVW